MAFVGGGSYPRPGEVSLAHHGVLFLDELPEFERHVLEVLREPLETGQIVVSRAARQVEFPAHFQLIAAMNPCSWVDLGDASGRCRCSLEEVLRPDSPADGETSQVIAARVAAARLRQLARSGKCNARLTTREVNRHCVPETACFQRAAKTLRCLTPGFIRDFGGRWQASGYWSLPLIRVFLSPIRKQPIFFMREAE